MVQNAIQYVIVKKNNKYCPRIITSFGNNWFREPYEYDNIEDAKKVLMEYKQKREEEIKKNKEEVVFTL